MSEHSDEQLVRLFRRGDQLAFEQLVRRHQDRIFRLASIWLLDVQFAQDVAQEVFIRSFKGLPRFQFRSTVFTWLYRMTKNVCHEFNRRSHHSGKMPATEKEQVEPRSGPATLTHSEQVAENVRQLVNDLPTRQRDVVLLRMFEELSVRDTAKVMGCREGTVKSLLHKATARLKEQLSDAQEGL